MPMSMDPYGGEFQGTVGRSSKGRFSKSFGKPCTKSNKWIGIQTDNG